jgi:hypothetical protein
MHTAALGRILAISSICHSRSATAVKDRAEDAMRPRLLVPRSLRGGALKLAAQSLLKAASVQP